MFHTVLIANRGEIACRVIRTCRRLGVATVAVCSEADVGAKHVREADRHVVIGPAPARDSYLSIEAVLAAAERTGAQAIHPGYGFLSENADFAAACAARGIAFVGPPAEAIRSMALKGAAKGIAEGAGVPTVPGHRGADQSVEALAEAAARVGWPVLLKPVAGGGGKGMRVVEGPDGFAKALATSRREAEASCGDPTVLIERYLRAPRHVEVQVAADGQGGVVHLFERDCSTQRRHQKVIEEAPAPRLDAATRDAMGRAAVSLTRAIGYVGVGTVEFLVETAPDGSAAFFFIEMNTRLQVEHPVTEMITGLDLVELQLRVAAGEPLGLATGDLAPRGHAIEARICAEDPARKFFPSPGTITALRFPAPSATVRVDAGVDAGDSITPFYDSLIAKLVVHGPDRPSAIAAMAEALDGCAVEGIRTNLALLRAVVADPAFRAGGVDTHYLEGALPGLLAHAQGATP